MGIETALIAGAAAGGLGGAIKGAKGTPDQVTNQTMTRDVAPASGGEQQLQSSAIQNYLKNQQLAGTVEDRIAQAQQQQDLAGQGYQNILGGQAFNLTPQEQAAIQATRQALVEQGSAGVNRMLDERLQQNLQSGVGRGLRGQALGALQGEALKYGAQQQGDIERQANLLSAQAAQQMPLARIQAQQGLISQGLSMADILRQNAIANRQALSNPALLNSMMNMRASTAGSTQKNVTPGQKGSFGAALLGGLGGATSGATSAGNVYGGIKNIAGASNITGGSPIKTTAGDPYGAYQLYRGALV